MVLSRLPASAYGPLGRVHARESRVGFGGYRVDDRTDGHREALREAIRRARAGRPWSEMTEYTPDCWHCIAPDFLADQLTGVSGASRPP